MVSITADSYVRYQGKNMKVRMYLRRLGLVILITHHSKQGEPRFKTVKLTDVAVDLTESNDPDLPTTGFFRENQSRKRKTMREALRQR